MADSEEELKNFLMKVKDESEKLAENSKFKKMKIMASGPIASWKIDGETMKTVTDYFLGLQNHCRLQNYDCSHEIKRHLLLGRNVMTKLVQFSSVTQSCLTLQPHGLQHAKPH